MSIFGMGNPLLDISVEAKDELLTKYSLTCPNAILADASHTELYKEITAAPYEAEYVAGGSCQNTIRVAQWMLQEPGATVFAGCVGKDAFADTLTACIKKDNVHAEYAINEELPTGTCAVLVVHKDRSMVANLAAANSYKIDFLKEEKVAAQWQKAAHFFVEGYFLTVTPESVQFLAEHATETKKSFGFSLAAPFICQFFTEPLLKVLEHSTLIIGNEHEAEALATKMGWEDKTPAAVAKAISALPKHCAGPRQVVITCGPHDCVVCTDGEVETFPIPKMADEDIVDANGAGDAFAGGFLAAQVKGKDVKTCVAAGIYSSQLILKTAGTTLPSTKPEFQF